MGGDKDKIRLLKQAIGYVVIAPDNFLQKCLYWIGRGGNGKGVLLRAIEDILGTENVSHVGISQLVEPWGRIRTEHSRPTGEAMESDAPEPIDLTNHNPMI